MKRNKWGFMLFLMVLLVGAYSGVCFADKAAVTIEAPDQAAKGTEVVVKLQVTHSANSFFHYTKWVQVKVNGKDTALWEYSMTDRSGSSHLYERIKTDGQRASGDRGRGQLQHARQRGSRQERRSALKE